MSKMNELSLALDELRTCGEGIIRAAEALRGMFMGDPVEEKPEDTPPAYTFAEVRKAFAAKSHEGYTEQIRGIIAGFGADRLSAVREEDYPNLMKALEELE